MPSHTLPFPRAIALLSLVVLAWGVNWPITKTIVREMSPLWSTALRCGIAAIALLVLLVASRQFMVPKRGDIPVVLSHAAMVVDGLPGVSWTPRLVAFLLFSGIVCTALAHWAMSVVNRSLPAVTTSLVLLATPAVGIVSGIAALGESMEIPLLFALALLIGGVSMGIATTRREDVRPAGQQQARSP
ncbi:MAG: DMT family transporter [Burkholderiaceae bacterium]